MVPFNDNNNNASDIFESNMEVYKMKIPWIKGYNQNHLDTRF